MQHAIERGKLVAAYRACLLPELDLAQVRQLRSGTATRQRSRTAA